MKNKINDALVP